MRGALIAFVKLRERILRAEGEAPMVRQARALLEQLIEFIRRKFERVELAHLVAQEP